MVSRFTLKFVLRNLARERLRSFLTLLGILIGMAGVVALLSISTGLRSYIGGQLDKLGSDLVFISPGEGSSVESMMLMGLGGAFDNSDKLTLENTQGVKDVWSRITIPKLISFGDESVPLMISGGDIGFTEYAYGQELYKIESGRLLTRNDFNEVVLPKEIADDAFSKKIRVGDKLGIGGEEFTVVGIISMPSGNMGGMVVFVPLKAITDIFHDDSISTFVLRVEGDPELVAERIKDKLERERGTEDFQVVTSSDRVNAVNAIITLVNVVLGGVAAIALVIGALGIMNTMYMSISEKTREIGIMKAIGATDGIVSEIFMLESAILGLVGGAAGVVFGYLLAKIVEGAVANAAKIPFNVGMTAELILGVLFISSLLGTLAGILPVRQAMALKPVEAMR